MSEAFEFTYELNLADMRIRPDARMLKLLPHLELIFEEGYCNAIIKSQRSIVKNYMAEARKRFYEHPDGMAKYEYLLTHKKVHLHVMHHETFHDGKIFVHCSGVIWDQGFEVVIYNRVNFSFELDGEKDEGLTEAIMQATAEKLKKILGLRPKDINFLSQVIPYKNSVAAVVLDMPVKRLEKRISDIIKRAKQELGDDIPPASVLLHHFLHYRLIYIR
jgi:hypothetical protein